MSRIVLHIGTHKTGTSFIQQHMIKHRAAYQAAGLTFPKFRGSPGHHGLVADHVGLDQSMRLKEGDEAGWRWLNQKYGQGDHSVFVSSEEIARMAPNSKLDFAQVKDWLCDFEEISVVVVVREQVAYLSSIYSQIALNRSQVAPRTLFKTALESDFFTGLALDYNKLLDNLEIHFTPERIQFLTYEDAKSHSAGILQPVLAAHLGDLDLTSAISLPSEPVNVSRDPLALFAANSITPGNGPAEPEVIEGMRKLIEDRFGTRTKTSVFNDTEIEAMIERFETPNRRLEERIRLRQPEFRVAPPKNYADHVTRKQLTKRFWMDAAKWALAFRSEAPSPAAEEGTASPGQDSPEHSSSVENEKPRSLVAWPWSRR
ncbi:MAG: hypothetical protein AAGA12_09650 [Pseudomonadota bacterium]